MLAGQFDRGGVGAGDAGDVMAHCLDDALQVHRDDHLILDDHDLAAQRLAHLVQGDLDQFLRLGSLDLHHAGDLVGAQLLDRAQQQCLARVWRQVAQMALGPAFTFGHLGIVHRLARALPDHVERLEQRDAQVVFAVQDAAIGQDRLQRGGCIIVAGALAAGQGARIATQKRKLAPDGLGQIGNSHYTVLLNRVLQGTN